MAKEKQSTNNGSNRSNGIFSDIPSLNISPIKLDGSNYLAWSRSCLLFIQARGLQGYITGKRQKPPVTDPTLSQWEYKNFLIISWLINSMQPQIVRGYLFLTAAKQIWDVAAQTYSHQGNDVLVYELQKKVYEMKQGKMSIAQYFSKLGALWQELD